jgi:succinoglycan biosynthesis protein ExoO
MHRTLQARDDESGLLHADRKAPFDVQAPNLRRPGVVHFISRQRIVSNSSGSAAYVLSLMAYLKSLGYRIHYVSPSPLTLGRWAAARLSPETQVFDRYRIRGVLRLGPWLIQRAPQVYGRAMLAILDRVFVRLGLSLRLGRPASYSIMAQTTRDDRRFLASLDIGPDDIIVLDYAQLTAALDDLTGPRVPSLVIMHDLVSSRDALFKALDQRDGIPPISLAAELELLGKADAIVAIQADEAAIVAGGLPGHQIVVAPMAVEVASEIQVGEDGALLFIGSMAQPNIDGLAWFLDSVWPAIKARHPAARLDVVGSVCHHLGPPPPGVTLHGVVPSTDRFYAAAGIVISPLRAGSGLKIKLIEAMGRGKAIVASNITLQGVGGIIGDSVRVADSPETWIAAIDSLIDDPGAREGLSRRSREIALERFGSETCYGGIRAFLESRRRTD